eukprot:CAMPEP_0202718204 /NCGR_PEP_ID=MMETSP1385-20130828/119764_1 /ASSEMBLY_ACC=CAM_ASM_000861 /TAXON_ID=933848 /ORGANISM="Elphidium margaritaceum" /LENGTH=93 /DNA_ID=CAMNT_0049380839 /DNA_START=263 /DNA_END=544 /DNA_ORIENTATION=+
MSARHCNQVDRDVIKEHLYTLVSVIGFEIVNDAAAVASENRSHEIDEKEATRQDQDLPKAETSPEPSVTYLSTYFETRKLTMDVIDFLGGSSD